MHLTTMFKRCVQKNKHKKLTNKQPIIGKDSKLYIMCIWEDLPRGEGYYKPLNFK